jgi:hypothetical protein
MQAKSTIQSDLRSSLWQDSGDRRSVVMSDDMIPVSEDNAAEGWYVLRALGRSAPTLQALADKLAVPVERLQLVPNAELRKRLQRQHRQRTGGNVSITPDDPFEGR